VGAPKTDALRTDAPKTDAPKCDRGQFRIVLDVGHSEEVPGAISARNVQEYDFNLRLAKQIEASLVADGFARTFLMVTHGPKYASLFQRVATANHHAANVFLSIHHDSVPDSYLEKWEYKGTPSHYSDRFHGHSLFVSRENLHFDASVQFGKLLGRQLKDHDLHYARQYASVYVGRNHHELVDPEVGLYRYDKLEVLRSTTMPAVLLEAGSIINRDEELRMGSREHRAVMVDAVTKAVEAYCDTHAPQIARAAKPSSKPASGAASKSGSGAPPKQASDAPPKLSGAQP
jgi:N-acetylmuramoyl-L-alanine amidase